MIKIKQINCVNCPKFCQQEDINKLRQLVDKFATKGYKGIKFNCQAGQQIIKNFNEQSNGYNNF